MLFLFADEELKSKQTLLNGTDSELFQLRVRRSSTTSYYNDKSIRQNLHLLLTLIHKPPGCLHLELSTSLNLWNLSYLSLNLE